jgi:hypothetical protein
MVLALALNPAIAAGSQGTDDGMVPLFNGKDLTGWANVNCGPQTFTVRDGMIITTGIPHGMLRTTKQYENFILELEWMHLKEKGNSGLFVWSDPLPAPGAPWGRAIEVQILDGLNTENYTSHGDLFSIQGATCKPDRPHPKGWMRCLPSEHRSKPFGQWNHYRVECNDGVIKLAVNGKVVSGISQCKPRKGYLCLEAEGSECHFRNLLIKELPSTHPRPEEVADAAQDFRPLYTGDLTGWKLEPGHQGHWRPKDWILDYDGKSPAGDLWTEKEFGDFVMICDWRWTAKPVKRLRPVILPSGDYALDDNGKQKEAEVLDAGDSGIYVRGSSKSQVNIWCWPIGSGEVYGYRTDKSMPPAVRAGVTPKVVADKPIGQWNRFIITMKGDRLTVDLNGKRVIDNAQLPGVAKRGRLALQHHGDPIQFANLFIRELDAPARPAKDSPDGFEPEPLEIPKLEPPTPDVAAFTKKLERIRKEVRQQLMGSQKPGGRKGEKDPSPREKRLLRWVMLFNTQNGEDYLKQLHGLGAILAVPEPKGGYLVLRDLHKLPAKGTKENLTTIQRIFWIDNKPASVQSLSKALGLTFEPPHVVAFFPEKFEKGLLEKELKYHGWKEDDILETRFKVIRRGDRYAVEVTDQKPKAPTGPGELP